MVVGGGGGGCEEWKCAYKSVMLNVNLCIRSPCLCSPGYSVSHDDTNFTEMSSHNVTTSSRPIRALLCILAICIEFCCG